MATFKEMCGGKLSVALQAMIDGLREQDAREGFNVAMNAWLGAAGAECFGCAAACAALKLTGVEARPVDFPSAYLDMLNSQQRLRRSEVLGVDADDLFVFEHAVNSARTGYFQPLARYLGLGEVQIALAEKISNGRDSWFCLHDDDWREKIVNVEAFVEKLKEAGL